MKNIRLIPRLDIKGSNLVKGVHLEGLRVIGDPHKFAIKYDQDGADELIYMDIVASLYGRNNLSEILERTVDNIFIPVTVGGGIRSVEDVRRLLRSGADKVAINTAAVNRPELIQEISKTFGSQCMVLSVEAKQIAPGRWEAYSYNGRERTGRDVLEWIFQGVDLGAGEILLTSVDREGTRKGFDVKLVRAVSQAVRVPVMASGGMGCVDDMMEAVDAGADAVAIADALHYRRMTLPDIREVALSAGINVRKL